MNLSERASDAPAGAHCILVVDSEVLIRMVIAQYLRECGYRVIEAATTDKPITPGRLSAEAGRLGRRREAESASSTLARSRRPVRNDQPGRRVPLDGKRVSHGERRPTASPRPGTKAVTCPSNR